MAVTTIAQQVTSIIGDWVPSEYPELYKDAFNTIADMIPPDSELWANDNINTSTTALTNSGEDVYKILRVVINSRASKQVGYNDFLRGEDTSSIYYHSGNYKNPIYSWSADGILVWRPVGKTPTIYYWKYANSTDFDTVSSTDLIGTLGGFPKEARLAAIIKSGINILYTKISDAVQEEEDAELLQMLSAQMQQLQQWLQAELQRINIPDKVIGVDKGNKK